MEERVSNFQTMTISDEDVNILLLGETGVGKSTFINAFANYVEYNQFTVAEESKVRCVVPTKFTVTNEDLEEKIVEIGKDNNENNSISQSATLETRSYVFPISKEGIGRIRLIDTPGIGDTRGIDQDNENMENILSYISHMENLHAICFLLKPNNPRLTVMFDYCIKQLLSRLEKSASKNIIFLFTNTRQTFYKPGDTTTALKTILQTIKQRPPFVEIKFTKDNVFCLDNESFRYLVAIKNGIQLGNKQSFVESWTHSVKECWRMLYFITGRGNSTIKITPHKVKDTMSVNEARRIILQLSQPLADIADLINDNIKTLDGHRKVMQRDNLSIADLKVNLYVPVINLRCKELAQPTTVCTANGCIEIYTVNEIKKYHYKQRCHDPCYLQNVPKEHIGSPELINCWAMTNRKCRICKCDFTSHMHIYYISETYEDKIDNQGVLAQIKDRETALRETKKIIAKIEARKQGYENEKNTIIKTMAKFAHFLQRNAIAPYNDAYKAYIDYLIDREKSQGVDCDFQVINYYNDLLKRYAEEKKLLDDALSFNSNANANVTAAMVLNSVETLYNLPHTGDKIKQLHGQMMRNQTNEHQNTEIVFEENNQQLKQKKQGNQNNQNKKSKANQKQRNKGKMGINQFDQPHMKAKDRGKYQNYQDMGQHNPRFIASGRGAHQGYHNMQRQNVPRFADPGSNPRYQHMNHHMFDPSFGNPNGFYGNHPPLSPQHYPGYPGNFQNYQQHGGPANMFPGQPFNYPQNPPNFQNNGAQQNQSGPGNFANYNAQQNQSAPGNFPNYNMHQNAPASGNYGGQRNLAEFTTVPNFTEFGGKDGNKTKSDKKSDTVTDPNFEEWYKNLSIGDSFCNSLQKKENTTEIRKYNNLSKKRETFKADTSDSNDSSSSNGDDDNNQDDDDDFKEFMKTNNLEYLVKDSSKINKKNNNDNSNRKQKNNNSSRSNFRGDDSDTEEPKKGNQSKSKPKSILSTFFGFS